MLDLAIAYVCFFAIVASVCSLLTEFWVRFRGLRQKNLRTSLIDLLDCSEALPGLAHSERQAAERCAEAVLSLYRRERALKDVPGHIPPSRFAGILCRLPDFHPPGLRRLLQTYRRPDGWDTAGIAGWFDQAMRERSDDWKRQSRLRLFCLGLLVAVVVNINCLHIYQVLSTQPYLATELADSAEQSLSQVDPDDRQAVLLQVAQMLKKDALRPLIGWGWVQAETHWWYLVIGWLITAGAASCGGPFWVDLLRSLLRRRDSSDSTPASGQPKAVAAKQQNLVGDHVPCVDTAAQTLAKVECLAPGPDWEHGSSTTGGSRQQYAWLANIARLSYDSPDAVAAALGDWAQSLEAFNDPGNGTQGYVLRHGEHIILCFRGTEQRVEDWATDARFRLECPAWLRKQQPAATGSAKNPRQPGWWQRCRAWLARFRNQTIYPDLPDGSIGLHRGFDEALDAALFDRIIQMVEAEAKHCTQAALWICGHSLGGALATVAALKWQLTYQKGERDLGVQGVLTIGQPRIGNNRLQALYDQNLDLHDRHVRVANASDPVSLVPAYSLGYRHVGVLWHFNHQKQLVVAENGLPQYLDSALALYQDWRGELSRSLGYHSAIAYTALLQSLCEADERG